MSTSYRPPKGSTVNWQDIQENTFTRWCNDMLSSRGRRIENLKTDLKDGVNLINILEVCSSKSIGKFHKHPKIEFQKTENLMMAFDFMKNENIKLVNIGPEDILRGNMRLILGLIWTLIFEYEVGVGGIDELLRWVQNKIPEYGITGWTTQWNDGKALCGLVDAICPGLIPNHQDLDPYEKYDNCTLGLDTAWNALRVDKLIYPEEMAHPKVDKMAVMTYIAQFRNISDQDIANAKEMLNGGKQNWNTLANAYGPGLIEGVKGMETDFNIIYPEECTEELVIKIIGPKDEAKVNVVQEGPGKYHVVYKPTIAGEYQIHVLLGGEHIPGSIFHVTVLEKESLGGEGMIRVYFSTTSSSIKGRKDVQLLETLLINKKVHLRPNFEPWHPVDLMERADREAVFRRAGTRNLPIVFVNDEYVGDYDALALLEEEGKLDGILNFNLNNMISLEEHMERLRANPTH